MAESAVLASQGSRPRSLAACNTGVIENRVRNNDSVITTALGGVCCKPSAPRSIDSTMTMRVNEVIAISNAGIMDSRVRIAT